MMGLTFQTPGSGGLEVLCLGSHPDDIEIGYGGTILRLSQEYPDCTFHWVAFSATGGPSAEAQRAAEMFAVLDA